MTRPSTRPAAVPMLLSLLVLVGCGGGGDGGSGTGGGDGGAPPSGVPTAPSGVPTAPGGGAGAGTLLEGVWESPCMSGSNVVGAIARRLIVSITERAFELNDFAFAAADCSEPLQVVTTRGPFTEGLPEDGRDVSDGIPIDVAVATVTLTPTQDVVAQRYNENMLCGGATWVPGDAQSIAGCADLAQSGLFDVEAPRTDYNRYFVDDAMTVDDRSDDTLVFGTLGASTDPSRRPLQVDAEVVFTRQPGGAPNGAVGGAVGGTTL